MYLGEGGRGGLGGGWEKGGWEKRGCEKGRVEEGWGKGEGRIRKRGGNRKYRLFNCTYL